MIPPLVFEPILKERVWGGNSLARLYNKAVASGLRIGESWEITDRPEGVSVVADGPFFGRTLRDLMLEDSGNLVGDASCPGGRFPLLVKILDAQEKLSLQVHPPAGLAAALGGEPKTEMWYVAEAAPAAALYAGLRLGTTRAEFEAGILNGTVECCFHRLGVKSGDAMFLPSGRVHAIGEGNVIFEIQQNSDTTYRVFDWNRVGLDGKPRALHIEASMRCIDFEDFEPELVRAERLRIGDCTVSTLVRDPLFQVEEWCLDPHSSALLDSRGTCIVIGVIEGELEILGAGRTQRLLAGGFALVPACLGAAEVRSAGAAKFLAAWPGRA